MTQAFELRAISLPVKVNRFTKVADVAGTDDAAMLSNRQRDVGLESRDQALDLCHGWFLPYSDAPAINWPFWRRGAAAPPPYHLSDSPARAPLPPTPLNHPPPTFHHPPPGLYTPSPLQPPIH